MPDVNGINNTNLYNATMATSTNEAPGTLTMNDFYELLAAQLKYQDADNPMDTAQMMEQMVQTQMIDAITQMSAMNMTTYASSMMGKEVIVAEVDMNGLGTGVNVSGVVTGVILGNDPIIYVDGTAYSMGQIMAVGDIPNVPVTDSNVDETIDPEI